MRAETIRFLNKTFVPCRPARTISRERSSSMRSRDHVLHNLTACRLQWPHAASGQEPHAFVFVAAVNNIDAVARDRVIEACIRMRRATALHNRLRPKHVGL